MVKTEAPHQAHHACLTGCALTYNSYRRGSRNFNKELSPTTPKSGHSQSFLQGDFQIIKETEEQTDTPHHQPPAPAFNKDRRRSSFSLAKLGISIKTLFEQ